MSKIEDYCEKQADKVLSFPHVDMFGFCNDKSTKEKYIAVIKKCVDDDVTETWTEMDNVEAAAIRKCLGPHNVRFFEPLMLTFSEWRGGVVRKNPITGTVYRKK